MLPPDRSLWRGFWLRVKTLSLSLVLPGFRFVGCRDFMSCPGTFIERTFPSQNLKENIDAGRVRLSKEDVQAIREVVDKANAAQGSRYPEVYMKALFADTPLP